MREDNQFAPVIEDDHGTKVENRFRWLGQSGDLAV